MVETMERSGRVGIVLGDKRTVKATELTADDWRYVLTEAITGLQLAVCKDLRTPIQIMEEKRFGMSAGHAPGFLHGDLRTDMRLLNCGLVTCIPNSCSWPHANPDERYQYAPQTERIIVLDCTRSERTLCMLTTVWSMRHHAGEYFVRAEHMTLAELDIDQLLATKNGAHRLVAALEHLHAAQQRCEEEVARQTRLMRQKRERLQIMLNNLTH